MRVEYMYLIEISSVEYNKLLENGWRRFGMFFFRPKCIGCSKCKPIRIKINEFNPSKSQRRIVSKNMETEVKITNLKFKKKLYDIYEEHSRDRFDQITSLEDFKLSFFSNILPAKQTEFYHENKLVASGFIDISSEALSSVYFYYKTEFSYLNLGTFGVIKEIEYAKKNDLNYYYLGYYIEENKSMAYKNRFKPYQIYDWEEKTWNDNE
jgi:leucyl-tRNA---protein transferase